MRGDVTTATEPLPISGERVKERKTELAKAIEVIAPALLFPRVSEIVRLIVEFDEIGVARFAAPPAQRVLAPLRACVRAPR